MKFNKILIVLMLAVVAISAIACAAPAAPTAAPLPPPTAVVAAPVPPVPTAVVAAAAGSCGTLNILYWQAVTVLNPHLSQGTKDYDGSRLVVEPLAAMGPDGVPVALLAAEVPTKANGGFSADGTSATWKLKTGVKWSDGTDFTADDVVFTWKYTTTPETGSTTAGAWKPVKSVEATDKNTIKVTFTAAQPSPNVAMVGNQFIVIQKKQFEPFIGAKAKDGPNLATVGTGPFKIKEAKPNDVITYDMSPSYRGISAGKPCFSAVTFKGGGDAASSMKAVCQTGEIDYGWNLQVEWAVLGAVAKAPDSKCVLNTAVSGNVERILINRSNPDAALGDKRGEPDQPHPFLADLKVRQALKLAINTGELAAQLYGETGAATCNIVPAPASMASKNTKCTADLAAANKLLDEAGWVKGSDGIRAKGAVKMKILYQTTVNALRQKEQAFVKDAWEKLGVQVELKSVQAGVFFGTDEANPDTASKFFADVQMFTNGPDGPDNMVNYMAQWTSEEIRTKAQKWGGTNYERFSNKEYDALYAQAVKETDPAKRAELVIKMNDILVNEVTIIPLVARTQPTDGVSKLLKGVIGNPWDSVLWNIADWGKNVAPK